MKTLGNLIWLVISGFWLGLGFAFAGLIACITIIGIPFGVQAFKLAGYALWPFGRTVIDIDDTTGGLQVIANIIWLLLFGWGIFVTAIGSAIILCITIIGIPFAIQAVKIGVLGLWPFGRTVVDGNARVVVSPHSGLATE